MNGTATVLQDVVRRESRSLLLYIGDSFPWTTNEHAPDLATLKQDFQAIQRSLGIAAPRSMFIGRLRMGNA